MSTYLQRGPLPPPAAPTGKDSSLPALVGGAATSPGRVRPCQPGADPRDSARASEVPDRRDATQPQPPTRCCDWGFTMSRLLAVREEG